MEVLEDIELKLVTEGKVELEVPASNTDSTRGPASARAPVFFNPAMRLARDVSVGVLRAAGSTDWDVLDGLAGSGVRGIRYAVEGPPPRHVTINDRNPAAEALCKRNVERNAVMNATVTRVSLEALVVHDRFHMIDVDPFGSPVGYLPGCVRAVRRHGILAATATDTPVLCGSRPKPCLRRYHARPWRGDAMHEVALRILAGAIVREAARTDRAASPVLSMAEDHFVRVFMRIDEGARRADEALGFMGYAWPADDGGVAMGPSPPHTKGPWAGPLWLGRLHDVAVLEAMASDQDLERSNRLDKLLGIWLEEAPLPPLLVDANRTASRLKVPSPSMDRLLGSIRSGGYAAGRAHTNPVGIKTDAPMAEVDKVFRMLAREG